MVDAVTTQTLVDNQTTAVMLFTNISDGTGESLVTKVNVANLAANATGQACTGVSVQKIHTSCHGMEFRLLWDATADVVFFASSQNSQYTFDFSSFGGMRNNASTGKTGNILLSTADASSGDTYTLILEMKKYYD
jgi:hypothetical protein